MTSERAQAYHRVMRALGDLGPAKLQPGEQERIRNAVDDLIFSRDVRRDPAASAGLEDVERLCRDLVDSGRWAETSAMRLADDVARCGPALLPEVRAA
ncbi:MAG: hypothetical protein HZB46_08295 [Solirubrobacterales bacterium]|nr:hypothetical protein [Solirubrobacterales bacterium]